ncbi:MULTISPECIES: YCF48-related protein [unclassified Leeuwenhoekiella]|uniref:YCF48-related protein n=1 Tax=unclassified Leeuwenhoekiella TaxID=2615029 RepID=UPI000C359DBD|nr:MULTISPECIES: YCF48-related protein [unclassified Leeuwenhoekiella]MAW95006.1 hypothetical protein [Leeuwenhoekiella sp.]MBA79726.1 hypothetical protein [Leeuwenhoekiella sp.]|tara:strand:- start:11433 stop:14681 length:3249 start_codon:yes stop_codon:yes gene_type:complete
MKEKLLILFFIVISLNKIYSQKNWELLNPKPTANTGKAIHFVSNDVGYIITSNELLETVDAGTTWQKKQNIKSGITMSFHNSIGYIAGNGGYVLRSTDKGKTWSQISTGFDSFFNSINIIDEDNIILSSSNSLIKSDDGGATWQSLSIPNSRVNKTVFTSTLVGHAVTDNGIILKTVDGGQNWYKTRDNSNTSPSNYLAVYFINENIGFASQEHSNMYKTTDAGETWVKIEGTIDAIYDFYFLDENFGYATGDHGATFKTSDGGATWNNIFFQSGRIFNTSMYGIYFQDQNIGYATGARGRIIKTTDGGETWENYALTYNTFGNLKIFDNGVGFTRSGNDYYKTTDYGDNWTFVSSADHYTYCNGFYFVNENIGYSIGGGTNSISGDVFKTLDGGNTWNQLNIYVDEGLSSVFFINEDIGFISGGFNQRKVMKTIDGGINWTQVSNQEFGKIQFVSELVGYGNRIGNYYGAMYKTIDGGNTWNVSIELEGEDINTFDFVDENNGYFVGDQGLIYKTNDGGTNWKKLEIPYEWYTQVNFLTKNVGYIADEDGVLYKTENGGISWEYLTQQFRINSIELVNDKIYTAGTDGKIYRSDVEYKAAVLNLDPAMDITNSGAVLTGNVTSNGTTISKIEFQYTEDYSFSNAIAATPGTVNANESVNLSTQVLNLKPNTTYYYRLIATQDSKSTSSKVLSFKTLPDFELTTNLVYNYSSTTAELSGTVISNSNDITNIEFEYGASIDALNSTVNATPASVTGNTTEVAQASLINLKSDTKYYYRIKATHQGEAIYGSIQAFTTRPEYTINLYSPNINGNEVKFSAYIIAYDQNITNITIEYGTIDYENSIVMTPLQVNANSSATVNATVNGLDTSLNYYYRLKATYNGETIYSEENLFNFSKDIIMVNGRVDETSTNSLELSGLINSYGAYLTNIHFEYGVTNNLDLSVTATPNFAYGYTTNLIKGSIENPLDDQTYYYRLVANTNESTIYSDTYKYTTGKLSLSDFDLEQQLSVYPNPATNGITIKSNSLEEVNSIELYNTLGQRVYRKKVVNNSDLEVDVSTFRNGVYFLKVKFQNAEDKSFKLIVN